MYLLADSGATKTDWILFDENGVQREFQTLGMNAMVLDEADIRSGPVPQLQAEMKEEVPEKIFFYGAGLRTADKVNVIRGLLSEVFPDTEADIQHDLLGAARATCGHEKGIVGILGTGSNSCLFDGKVIQAEMGGHGYLFGDEGSGADLGKELIKMALDGNLPESIVTAFEAYTGKSLLQVRNDAYLHPHPNNYFAELSRFLYENLSNATLNGLVIGRFATFLGKTVLRYPGFMNTPAHFVGSIAHVYEEPLRTARHHLLVKAGTVLKAPARALVTYHSEELFPV